MNNTFNHDEKLYRAIYPPEIARLYWKQDGSLSYKAFEDPKGLSVDRGDYRPDSDVVIDMHKRLTGYIFKLYVKTCKDAGTVLKYLPSNNNPYHSEIHGNNNKALLSKHQSYLLAKKATLVSSN